MNIELSHFIENFHVYLLILYDSTLKSQINHQLSPISFNNIDKQIISLYTTKEDEWVRKEATLTLDPKTILFRWMFSAPENENIKL